MFIPPINLYGVFMPSLQISVVLTNNLPQNVVAVVGGQQPRPHQHHDQPQHPQAVQPGALQRDASSHSQSAFFLAPPVFCCYTVK